MRTPQLPLRTQPGSAPPFHVWRRVLALAAATVLAAGIFELLHSVAHAAPQDSAPPTSAQRKGGAKIGDDVRINRTGFTSARVCGRCHVDIYSSWKNSLHAFSLSDPVFDTAYMLATKEAGDAARKLCLRCHAPLTMSNGDYELRQAVTAEGVTCDFCHTVTAVQLDDSRRPYVLQPGLVKRSILRHASSPKHDVAFSELHGKAEFCGGCHNYVAPNGTPIMTTYDEWREGPYAAEGKPCQHCHMALGAGRVVSRDIKETGPDEIHLHRLIHDSDQLRSALKVEIVEAVRRGQELRVTATVKNVGSGHKVPTGIPSREINLVVSVDVGGRTQKQERRYRRVLADKDGVELKRDHQFFLHAASVVSDNRIAPREERFERFKFWVPKSGKFKVEAELTYQYAPLLLEPRPMVVRLHHAERYGP